MVASLLDQRTAARPLQSLALTETTLHPPHPLVSKPIHPKMQLGRCKAQSDMLEGLAIPIQIVMLRLLVSISVHHNQVTVVSAVPVTAANLLMDNSRSSHSNSSSKISPIVLVLVKALWALLAKNYIFQLFPPLFFCLLAQLQF